MVQVCMKKRYEKQTNNIRQTFSLDISNCVELIIQIVVELAILIRTGGGGGGEYTRDIFRSDNYSLSTQW